MKMSLRLGVLLAACSLSLLTGCAVTSGQAPRNSNEVLAQVAVSGAITVAVERLVTRDRATPAEVEARAARVVLVVDSLKALGSDALATLPQIRAALDPLLDRLNLSPGERHQADLLVAALVAVGLERVDAAKHIARVSFVLDELHRAASEYLPRAETARIGHDHLRNSLAAHGVGFCLTSYPPQCS
jgi:hypothetical protein